MHPSEAPKNALTPGPSPISRPPYPRERGERHDESTAVLLFVSPLPAGAREGDGRGAGGEGAFGRAS